MSTPGPPTVDVSVVICTHDRARLLDGALAALAAQDTPPGLGWEMVVVDNNSRDDTPAVVERRAPGFPVRLRRVFEARQGLSLARNTGVAAVAGRIVAFTDDDGRPAPDWLAAVVRAFEEWTADIVGGRILLEWPGPVPAWLERERGLHRILGRLEIDYAHTITAGAGPPQIWGTNMAFRRAVLVASAGFDPRRGLVGDKLYRGEETALIAGLIQAGRRAVFDPRLVVRHDVRPERMRRGYFRRYFRDLGEQQAILDGVRPRRPVLGFSPWQAYHAVREVGRWLTSCAARRPDGFRRELDIHFAIGYLRGTRRNHRAHRPAAP